ncbi:MAG: TlpA family protein disulfide reductase [Opitutaceae bacterium]|nr:TlpA family protein disulfide reductase [Opitutaceae bacterium]
MAPLVSLFRTLCSGTALAWLASAGQVAAATEFHGKLAAQVEPGTRVQTAVISAPADLVALLPVAVGNEDRAWTGSRPASIKGNEYRWVIVASATGDKVLWFDRDRSGRFEAAERFPFDVATKAVAFDLPWENGIYRAFPLRFEYSTAKVARGAAAEVTPAEPVAPTTVTAVVYNFNLVYQGAVEVEGRSLALAFYPLPAVTEIDPARIRTSVDANFNGRVENELGEMDSGRGKAPVFRVGSRILAVKSVDLKTGDIVVEQRPDSDYTRFDAQPGQVMPDFAFVDFSGTARKLADYRGKFVLLDFWGTWCGPCIEEMKHLDPLYATYAPRGLEVIGMNMEKTAGNLSAADYAAVTDKARSFIAKAGHRWIQATQESIERVALDVLHVNSYPTCILVDPEGRVLSRYARGDTLQRLLAEHLPAGKQPVEK